MATSNSKPSIVLLLPTFITFFLLFLNKGNSADDLSFNFNKFDSRNGLIFQGESGISTSAGELHVTWVEQNGVPRTPSRGRVLYSAPVRIWDSSSGKVASFSTSFSFAVKAVDATITADGLAFFLAPIDSEMPSGGNSGFLALFNDENYNSSNQIVAVEFDTYANPWDPSARHIGIDVNTIKSTKTTTWEWKNGEVAVVFINYIAPTKTLTVSLTYPSTQTTHVVSAYVDLKATLPEFVRVGFSATSAGPGEAHRIYQWSFTSSLEGNNNAAAMENNMLLTSYSTL